MARISVTLKIDVTKIDKARLFKGAKGTYLDASVFIDLDNTDQYGNHGMITQQVSKEERDQGIKGNILGNGKIVWRDAEQAPQQQYQPPQQRQAPAPQQQAPQQQQYQAPQQGSSPPPPMDNFNDDIPF